MKEEEQTTIVYDVFLAYSAADEEAARRIFDIIGAAGLRCFMSAKSLMAGDVWGDTIRSSLIKSREILLLCSPASISSEWVQTELGAAWALHKRVIPVLLRLDVTNLPRHLAQYQAFDFHEIGSDSHLVEQLLARSK